MAQEPENMTLVLLREIRAKQDEHTQVMSDHTRRFEHMEKRLDDLTKIVRYALGQSSETQFRQSEQEARIDELFKKLEHFPAKWEPVRRRKCDPRRKTRANSDSCETEFALEQLLNPKEPA